MTTLLSSRLRPQTMPLRSFNPCFVFSRRAGAIAVSCFLIVFSFVFMVLCFSQLSAGSMLRPGTQAAFAIASILQVTLVGLASTIIFASWEEDIRLIRLSVYLTVTHLVVNLVVLVCLLVAVGSIVTCGAGRFPCSNLVVAKPAWDVLSVLSLLVELYLSVVVFSYFVHLKDHSRRACIPEVSSRSLSTPSSHKPDYKRLLSISETDAAVELSAVEPGTTARSFSTPEPEAGYGGGLRTYEEAEQNEKERLRREMENEGNQAVSFPIPSTSGTGILTPLGLEWRDGDLPPYTSR